MSETNTNNTIHKYKREWDPRVILDTKETRTKLAKQEKWYKASADFPTASPEEKWRELGNSLYRYFNEARDIDPKNPIEKEVGKQMFPFIQGVEDLITKHYCSDFSQLAAYRIDNRWTLELVYTDGRRDFITLLSDSILLTREASEKNLVREQWRISREKLSEWYEVEKYLWWDVIVTFRKVADEVPSIVAWAAVGKVLYDAAKQGKSTSIYQIATIMYRTAWGTFERVKLGKESILHATKEELAKNVVSVLADNGIIMDNLTSAFAPKSIVSLHKVQFGIMKMSYADFVDQVWKDAARWISKVQFEQWRHALITEMELYNSQSLGKSTDEIVRGFKERFIDAKVNFFAEMKPNEWKARNPDAKKTPDIMKSALKGAIKYPFEYLMWWVFFKKYHENMQDTGSLYASAWEQALFRVGAGIWTSLNIIPGWGKIMAWIGIWILFVGWWEKLAHAVDLDKKFWRYFPDREDESFKETGKVWKGIIEHILSGEAIHEVADMTKKDIWVPGMRAWLHLRTGKNTMIALPDVRVYQYNIDFGTNPRLYLNSSPWRDQNTWNEQVDAYQKWLMPEVIKMLKEYRSWNGYFHSDNIRARATNDQDLISDEYNNGKEKILVRYDKKSGIVLSLYAEDTGGMNRVSIPISSWLAISDLHIQIEQRKFLLDPSKRIAWKTHDEQRNDVLKERLEILFGASKSWALMSIINGAKTELWQMRWVELAEYISSIADISDINELEKRVGFWLWNQTEMLKLTPKRVSQKLDGLKENKYILEAKMTLLAWLIVDPQQKTYLLSFFSRIQWKERLVSISEKDSDISKARKDNTILEEIPSGAWIATPEFLWQKWKKWVEAKEHKWFREMIEDTTVVTDANVLNVLRDPTDSWTLTFSDGFYKLLNEMVGYKREFDFFDNLQRTWFGTKWHGPDFLEKSPQKPNGMLKAIKDNPLRF